MKKLWQKNKEKLNKVVEAFETKDDILLDEKLAVFDVQGSLAHAKMLQKIGILTEIEYKKLKAGLNEILQLIKSGKFGLKMGDEDIHTKIENYLTQKYGVIGKKIHTARSRNDQVLTALRLYSKANLTEINKEIENLISSFENFSSKHGSIQMPGYTHMQKAMPSSIGLWCDSFVAGLKDDLIFNQDIIKLINQSPLGSAAGYGIPIKIDRECTAKLLKLNKVQENAIYCQHSRGKFEAQILSGLVNVLLTINKFASDVMLFSTSEFGFFEASSKITTGSSIMPQKKNLDLAELLRSKVHLVLGNYIKLVSLSSNLPSGYNRDLQDSKKPLIESFEITIDSLSVTQILLENLTPNEKKIKAAITEELVATEKALNLVLKGLSFRDAYKKVGLEISKKKGGEKNEAK